MSQTRRKHSAAFKTKVVLEMLKERQTLAEISGTYGVHATQLTKWKRTFLEGAGAIFSDRSTRAAKVNENREDDLYKKIGQLQIELDWLKKNPASAFSHQKDSN